MIRLSGLYLLRKSNCHNFLQGTPSPYSVPGAVAWVTDCSQNRESVSLNIQRVNHSCRLMIDCAKDWDGWGVSCGGSSFFAIQTEPALTRSLTSNKATSRLVTTIYLEHFLFLVIVVVVVVVVMHL
ncbi:hypothetical protein Tsp_10947 [Trichinella spiralis]|uniref:hypothetical protein n=1 Tax=Trichinella spiralis TaxID=6334 RepID=UPI0001EFBC39|nr:hypothetical protein Tsp_10947 [Trichinella spiralis]